MRYLSFFYLKCIILSEPVYRKKQEVPFARK